MKRLCLTLVLVSGLLLESTLLVPAQEARQPSTTEHPYVSLATQMETRLRFVTDLSFPEGPALQVKIYDWIIGPRQEFQNFPLEGFATIEVKAGEVETTMDGMTVVRHEGEHWIVPAGTQLSLRIKPETGRGDNIVSLHGVVVIRK
jgi:hypothetical protein